MGKKETILLLVDDDPVFSLMTKKCLQAHSFGILTSQSGEDAVRCVRENRTIDLILMDIDLGEGMDGTEAANIILKEIDIPILFLTSHTEREYGEKADAVSSYGYIIKNTGETVLLSSIRMALRLYEARMGERSRELEARKAKDLLQNVFDAMDSGLVVLDRDYKILKTNRWIEDHYCQKSHETFHGKKCFQIFRQQNIPCEDCPIQRTRDTGKRTVEVVPYMLNREIKGWLELSSFPLWNENGEISGFIEHYKDVTLQHNLNEIVSANEDLLNQLFSVLPVAGLVWDADGKLIQSNQAFTELLGYTSDDIPDIATWFPLAYPDKNYRNFVSEEWQGITKPVAEGQYLVCAKDRSTKNIFFKAIFLPDKRSVVTLTDVTNYETIKAEVQRLNSLQSLLLRLSTAYLEDFHGNNDEFVVSSLESIGRIMGADRSYIFAHDWQNKIAINTHEWCQEGIEPYITTLQSVPFSLLQHPFETLLQGKPFSINSLASYSNDPLRELLDAQGIQSLSMYPIIEDGVCTGTIGFDYIKNQHIFTDEENIILKIFAQMLSAIRKSQKRRKELLESEERFRLLSQVTMEAIVIHKNGVARDINTSFERLFGFSRDEVIGNDLQIVFHPDDLDLIREKLKEEYTKPYIVRGRRKNGEEFPVEIESRNFTDNNERLRVAALRDVTQRLESQRHIERLLVEKETLLREVHHRIKNNMNVIMSLLSLQASRLDPLASQALNDARNRLQSMEVLYDKLYRSEAVDSMDIRDYLEPLASEILTLFPRGSDVRLKAKVSSRNVSSKILGTLGILVSELITNSLKHAFKEVGNPEIFIEFFVKDNRGSLKINDNGVGIPQWVDFEDPSGFGLTLIQALSLQLGGEMRFTRDRGTCFTLEFPL